MKKCRCGRVIGENNRYSRNKIHTDYCSRFCYESVMRNNRIRKTAVLECECYGCGATMTLQHEYTLSNARYCSHQCYLDIGQYKNGIRDILMLNALYERGPISLEELSRIAQKGVAVVNGVKSVASILRIWIARDCLVREGAYYQYVSSERPGALIKKYSKKRHQ